MNTGTGSLTQNPLVIGKEVRGMFASLASRYDLTNSVLSFGIHHLWRRALMREITPQSATVIVDLCTGTGDLLPGLAKRAGIVLGADFCLPMLQRAQEKIKRNGQSVPLLQADGLALPLRDSSCDYVTVAFGVRNFESLETGLKEVARVLKPQGRLVVLEFGQPQGLLFGNLFKFYSRFIMPFIGGVITGNRAAYEYLPKTSALFPCAEKFEKVLTTCGLKARKTRALTGGIAYIYVAEK